MENARIDTDDGDLRIGVEQFKKRLEAGEPMTVLDARNKGPWQSSPVKVPGAIRWTSHIDPSWPKDRLTVVY